MPTLEEINRQIEKLPDTYIFWTQKEIRALPEILTPGERILALTSGFMEGTTWLAVCTSKRVIFLNRGMIFGLKQTQMALDRIQSIDHETTLIFANMRIWDGATAMVMRMSLNQSIKTFVKVTKEAIDAYKGAQGHSGASGAADVATQLEKLVALKEKGYLTDQEFQEQKKKILG